MKKINLLLHLLLFIAIFQVKAQRVTNVDWKLDEASEKINLSYDLNKEGNNLYYDIAMKVIVNGKTIIPKSTSIAGEVGKFQRIGKAKKIAWDVREYAEQLDGANIQFQITASTNTDGSVNRDGGVPPTRNKPKNLPVYAGLGGVATIGLGLIIGGVTSQNNAKDDYDKSLADINTKTSLTSTQKQTEVQTAYDDFNPKYRKGQGLLYGGIGVFAISAGILVYRIYWNNKLQSRMGGVYPIIEPNYTVKNFQNPSVGLTMGIGIKRNF